MSHVDDLDSRFLLKANDALEPLLLCFIATFQRPFFSETKNFLHGSQPASAGRPKCTAHGGNKKLIFVQVVERDRQQNFNITSESRISKAGNFTVLEQLHCLIEWRNVDS
jgi:hypothetical protein